MKNCPDVSPVAAHLNTTTIPTRTPASSGRNQKKTHDTSVGAGVVQVTNIFNRSIPKDQSYTP